MTFRMSPLTSPSFLSVRVICLFTDAFWKWQQGNYGKWEPASPTSHILLSMRIKKASLLRKWIQIQDEEKIELNMNTVSQIADETLRSSGRYQRNQRRYLRKNSVFASDDIIIILLLMSPMTGAVERRELDEIAITILFIKSHNATASLPRRPLVMSCRDLIFLLTPWKGRC